MQITNCHIHTFTHEHTPERYVPWPANVLARNALVRRFLIWLARLFDPGRRSQFARYMQILEVSFERDQASIFETVRGFYPDGTRFVVLPMDMTFMGAGSLAKSIDDQHRELGELRDRHSELVLPFAAVDPRHDGIVDRTVELIEQHRFRGIKLYPALGFHPNDTALRPLYAYAEEHGVPVLSHCSRLGVEYRGEPTQQMRTDPVTGARLDLDRAQLIGFFTDPDSYVPILEAYPKLKICLAHFGGDEEWRKYLDHPGEAVESPSRRPWITKILDLLRSGAHPGLWTDVSYTVFADDEFVYLLKVLLAEEAVRSRVLFGSDFYVVDNAQLEERRRATRVRAVLGEELFTTIAHDNPVEFLGL